MELQVFSAELCKCEVQHHKINVRNILISLFTADLAPLLTDINDRQCEHKSHEHKGLIPTTFLRLISATLTDYRGSYYDFHGCFRDEGHSKNFSDTGESKFMIISVANENDNHKETKLVETRAHTQLQNSNDVTHQKDLYTCLLSFYLYCSGFYPGNAWPTHHDGFQRPKR